MDGSDARRWNSGGLWLGVLVGFLGLLPWLAAGERLPLQNLWRTSTMPADMPWSMLPLSQYYPDVVIGLLVSGGLAAGLLVRWRPGPGIRRGAGFGLLLTQSVAACQAFSVLVPGQRPGLLAAAYVAGLVATCLLGIALAQLVLRWTADGPAWLAAMGVSLAAAPVATWLGTWLQLTFGEVSVPAPLWTVLAWVPALLTGVALAWCGWGGRGRSAAWGIGLLLLWLQPALLTGVRMAVARNTVSQGAASMVETFLRATATELATPWPAAAHVALAAGIGLVGGLTVRILGRRGSRAAQPVELR